MLLEQPRGCSRLEIRLAKQAPFIEYGKPKVMMYQSSSNDYTSPYFHGLLV